MPSSAAQPLLTARDLDILAALDHCPLTVLQLLKLSQTFKLPFTDERRVRERMQILHACGRVRRWLYATAGRGAPNGYTLTRLGYQLLHGPDAVPPTRRCFDPVGIARQHHTHALADFVVHTATAAHETKARLDGFCRENTVRLTAGGNHLYPDCAFQLLDPSGMAFRFFVELDNGTERVRSQVDIDSWERKIRLYEAYQDECVKRFRVLIVATRSPERLKHILAAATALARNPDRSLFYGITLADYLRCPQAVTAPCFRDHHGRAIALLPPLDRSQTRPEKADVVVVANASSLR